jgi:hypothetical protein
VFLISAAAFSFFAATRRSSTYIAMRINPAAVVLK